MAGITVILLAAGESTRMGRQKALLPWRHAPTLPPGPEYCFSRNRRIT